MPKVNPCHKEQMMKLGVWAEFIEYRNALLAEEEKPTKANKRAVHKFLGPKAAETASVIKKEPKETSSDNPVVLEPDPDRVLPPNTDPELISSIPGPPPPVALALFSGKPAVSEIENITWVCDNMRVVDVSPGSCPSLRAWNLLCECRENKFFRVGFWKDQYGKTVPAKSTLDDKKKPGDIDGQPTIALIDRILAISDKAKEKTK